MEKETRILEDSIKRLKKEIEYYEKELTLLEQERLKVDTNGEDSKYLLRNIEDRKRETQDALDSTRKILGTMSSKSATSK